MLLSVPFFLSITSTLIIDRLSLAAPPAQFRVTHEWNYINFTWPNEEVLQLSMANGFYIPDNIVLSGIDHYKGYYYLALPRMKTGTPATLARIPSKGRATNPNFEPFPSWSFNQIHNCSALQNVQNFEIDHRGIMWILDGGHINTLGANPTRNCAAKLIIFDINKNTTIRKYQFPEEVAGKQSFLYDLVLDEGFAYITDNSNSDPGLIIYDYYSNQSWKIRDDKTMRADRNESQLRINRVVINASINLAGIALGPKFTNNSRTVFYTPISSKHIYSIDSEVLKNPHNFELEQEIHDLGVKSSQSDGIFMDADGILYYGLLGDNSIARWNSNQNFVSSQKVIARDTTYIQWTNSFSMDDEGNLLVLTDRLQNFISGQMDLSKANFWILSAHTGGKSYLGNDQNFSYTTTYSTTTTTTSVTTTISVNTTTIFNTTTIKPTETSNRMESTTEENNFSNGLQVNVTIMLFFMLLLRYY